MYLLRSFVVLSFMIIQICCEKNEHNIELDEGEDPLVVITANGKLRGKLLNDIKGKQFYAFQKIPYGKKPLADLRFKPLEKPDKWENILNATEPAPDCLQPSTKTTRTISEDCIYLNVFTHRHSDLHPVMVYINGERSLTSGSSNPETTLGPEFLMTQGIVLVTFNYRLGILGFLNYEYQSDKNTKKGREEISSNNGFKDQVFALQWIQDNIEHFGGDKNSVTIFGNSGGATSVHALLLSPLTEYLFHRAIIQSGTVITKGLSMNNSAVYIGEILGLETKNTTNLIKSLRNLTEKEILDLQDKIDLYSLTNNKISPIGLVLEKPGPDSFMTENPWTLIKTGRYHRRPVIFGFSDAEGLIYYVQEFLKNTKRYLDVSSFVPYYYRKREIAALQIDEDFFPKQNYSDIKAWVNIWSYSSFIYDILRCVKEHVKWSNVYLYEFQLDTVLNWSKKRSPKAAEIKGACHGDELGYIFKNTKTPEIQSGSDLELYIDKMVTLWTNFATFGMPTIANDSLLGNKGQQWIPIREDIFHMLRIDKDLVTDNYNLSEIQYWDDLYHTFSNGACHGDELGYIFKNTKTQKIQPGSDLELYINRMVMLWTNFATFGMPTIANDSLLGNNGQQWIPIRERYLHMLRIDKDLITDNYNLSKIQYWDDLYHTFSNGIL